VIYCALMMILELKSYSFMDAFICFPYCSRVDLLLFKVLMCRFIVSLKYGK
jgi:hypothetical protein